MNDRSLENLQKNENCLWARWSCLWRPDVTLEFLFQLEKDLEVVVLQISVRFQCICVCTGLNPAQANRGVASQPTSQTPPPVEASLLENQSRPAPVIDQQTPPAAATSPFSNIQTSALSDLPPASTLRHRRPSVPFSKGPKKVQDIPTMHPELVILERIFNMSQWLANNVPEPVIGHPSCPNLAEKYGTRGESCYMAFVEKKADGTYGCRHAGCGVFLTSSLDDAVRHQRSQHFDHRPFVCIHPSGRPW